MIGEIETSRGGFRAALIGVPFSVAAVLALGWPTGALAQAITEYALPAGYSNPVGITSGPDGALWFTDANGSTNYVGRITATASNPQITEHALSNGYGAYYITTGSDGNLWFTDTIIGSATIPALGNITTGGTINEFNFPNGVGGAKEIVTGADSALWFPQGGVMGHMTTGGTYSNFMLPGSANSTGVTLGPDNNVWFTDQGTNAIGRITTGGSVSEFTISTPNSMPQDITPGPDGNLWFTETTGNKIGRITTGGTITEFTIPTANSGASGIVKKGNALWFTEPSAHKIGRITVGGVIAEFPTPVAGSAPTAIVAGSDGALWFVDANGNAPSIGRVQPPETAHDFNNDSYSDIFWRDNSGNMAIWEMSGSAILNENTAGFGGVPTVWSIIGQHDFNGDGNADVLWRNTSGDLAIWEMNGTTILNVNTAGLGNVPTVWSVAGVGDFNGDGMADILWRNTSTGDLAIWLMNGTTILNANTAGLGNVPLNWSVVGVGDFNGDGMADILWRNTTNGNVAIWLMNGTTLTNANTATFGNMPSGWFVAGTGDFNGDGKSDILWRDGSGDLAIWEMNGTTILNPNTSGVGNLSTVWSVAVTGDFNSTGMSGILWTDTSGDLAIWYMNGTTISSGAGLGTMPTSWTIQGTNAD